MHCALLIAKRLYGHDETTRVARPAVRVASIGVAVGVAIMLVTIGVSLGFKHTIRDKVLAMHGDIQVLCFRSLSSQESYPILMDDTAMTVIKGCGDVVRTERYVSKAGMLRTGSAFHGVQLVGTEGADSTLALSQMLARRLQVSVGDKLDAYFFERTIRARRFEVERLYATHMEEFDNRMVLAPYDVVHKLTGWAEEECSGVRIFTDGRRDAKDVAYDISRALSPYSLDREYVVVTADELSPQVFAWLTLLDTNVWIILALMLCVASFTMMSGLLILILEHTPMVALLKSVGATDGFVRSVFLHLATMIMMRAMLWGNIVGLVLLAVQHFGKVVTLNPAEYYIDVVPVEWSWGWFAVTNVATLAIAVLALMLPALVVPRIRPAAAMRIE